jgi:hypothetical protein
MPHGVEVGSGGAVSGFLPRVGDTVLVGPSAGPHFTDNSWLQVTNVRTSTEPGWIYIDGRDARAGESCARTLFVRVAGLVIRRAQAIPA